MPVLALGLHGMASVPDPRECRASWRSARVREVAPRGSTRCHPVCHACANLRAPLLVESPAAQLMRCAVSRMSCKTMGTHAIREARRGPTRDAIIRSDAVPAERRTHKASICRLPTDEADAGTRTPDPIITSNDRRRHRARMIEPKFSPRSAPCATRVPFCKASRGMLGRDLPSGRRMAGRVRRRTGGTRS